MRVRAPPEVTLYLLPNSILAKGYLNLGIPPLSVAPITCQISLENSHEMRGGIWIYIHFIIHAAMQFCCFRYKATFTWDSSPRHDVLGSLSPPGKKNLTPIGTSPNFFKPQGFPLAPTSVDPALKVKYVQK